MDSLSDVVRVDELAWEVGEWSERDLERKEESAEQLER